MFARDSIVCSLTSFVVLPSKASEPNELLAFIGSSYNVHCLCTLGQDELDAHTQQCAYNGLL